MVKFVKIILILFSVVLMLFAVNWGYQVFKKPMELVGLINPGNYKSAKSSWQVYEDDFDENGTSLITKYYLAALSQVESGGNAWATPKWRWRWTTDIGRIYAPASSSVGLFQYTNATFEDAKRFCIHWGKSIQTGNWYDFRSCWFNRWYTRLSAADSIEMTSARLDFYIKQLKDKSSMESYQNLASVIHLCGLQKGKQFVRDGFKFVSFQRCGSHDVKRYVNRVQKYKRIFQKM
jgi:hypothetical protein